MRRALLTILASGLIASAAAGAAEVTVVSTLGVQGVLDQVKQEFEQVTSHRLNIRYGTAAPLKRQIEGGEVFDVAILTAAMVDDLVKQGKVVGGSAKVVAKTGIGVAVRKGAKKPAVESREALRRTLLDSQAISYTKEGQSGTASARMIGVLGIADEMQQKTHLDPRPAGGLLAVTEGKAELAFALISEIVSNDKVDFVAPLPADLQSYVVFSAGVATDSKEGLAAKAFVEFLLRPEVAPVLRKLGME